MAVTAKDIIDRVAIDLHDTDHVRWPLANLILWIGDGLTQIASAKPSAVSKTVTLDLDAGTTQTLPAGATTLLRAVRNAASGRAVTPVERHQMDMFWPNWQSPDTVPWRTEVEHISYDPLTPAEFMVFPGNDGTGQLVVVLAGITDTITPNAGTDGTEAVHFTTDLGLSAHYRSTLTNYVLYRAFAPDQDTANASARAMAYLQLVREDLGLRAQTEASQSPDTITQPGA